MSHCTTEDEMYAKIKELDAEACRAEAASIGVLRELRKICTHKEQRDYAWEHDNGYGRQSIITGKQCKRCLMVDYYGYGRFTERF